MMMTLWIILQYCAKWSQKVKCQRSTKTVEFYLQFLHCEVLLTSRIADRLEARQQLLATTAVQFIDAFKFLACNMANMWCNCCQDGCCDDLCYSATITATTVATIDYRRVGCSWLDSPMSIHLTTRAGLFGERPASIRFAGALLICYVVHRSLI